MSATPPVPAVATTGPLVETAGGWAGPIALVIGTLLVLAGAVGLLWAFVTGAGSVDAAPIWAQSLAVLIISLVVVLMTSGAATLVRRRLRFGPSALILDQRETPPGGVLSGRLDCHLLLDTVPRFDIELQCLETVRSRSARSSTRSGDDTTTTQVWADEYECLGEASVEMPGGTLVPIRFSIPADARETALGGYPQIAWQLRIASPQPGLDFVAILPVTIRATAPPWTGAVRTPRPVPDDQRPGATLQTAWSDDGQELEIRFGRARNPAFAWMGTCCAAGAWWGAWGYGHAAAWLPMAVCLLPGLLMTWVALRAWLLRTVITVRHGDITINRSIIGLGSPQRYEVAPGTRIDLEQHVAVNNHGLRKLTLLQDGRKVSMGSLLRSHGEALFLQRLMNARLLGSATTATTSVTT